jgi:hypothetical protein
VQVGVTFTDQFPSGLVLDTNGNHTWATGSIKPEM